MASYNAQRMKYKENALTLCYAGVMSIVVVCTLMTGQHTLAHGQTVAAKTPAGGTNNAIEGASLFAANCGVCHGSDGRSGERAPNIATRREVVSRSDAELIRIVRNGVPGTGMPAFSYLGPEKIDAIVHHLRILQGIGAATTVPGDPRAGETLFFGKAACSACHMMNGRGGFIAADLSGYGQGRSTSDLRTSIVNPDRRLDRTGQLVTIEMMDGKSHTGFIRNEDNFSVVLQTQDGIFQSCVREKIASVQLSGRSSMPRDYASRLSSRELDDLISYLSKSGATERKAAKDDDE